MDFDRKTHVLVIDDDHRIRQLIARYLTKHDFVVMTAENAADATVILQHYIFDILIVDVMMPGKSGFDLTTELQKTMDVPPPVLLLTARGEAEDRIKGLECGADDYLVKPFEPRELLLRLEAILKRVRAQSRLKNHVYFGPYCFDASINQLKKGQDEIITLSSTEQKMLGLLVQQNNDVLTRDMITQAFGDAEQNERTIDVQINRLRKKIEDDSKNPRYLHTVRGKGYVLNLD